MIMLYFIITIVQQILEKRKKNNADARKICYSKDVSIKNKAISIGDK